MQCVECITWWQGLLNNFSSIHWFFHRRCHVKFGFGRDVPPRNLKVDPYKYQFFKKKWPFHKAIGPILAQIFEQNRLIFPKFSYIWANFGSNLGTFWKIEPFIYQILSFVSGHWYTKKLILLPMLETRPRRVFCTE